RSPVVSPRPAGARGSIRHDGPVPSLRELLEIRTAVPADAAADYALVQANLTGTMQLYRVPLAGGELERLTDEAEPVGGQLLPDGRIVASMDAGGDEREQLYLLEPGGPLEPLVVEPEFIHWDARISPDGRLLAYACNRRNGVDLDIVVRELQGGEERAPFAPGG